MVSEEEQDLASVEQDVADVEEDMLLIHQSLTEHQAQQFLHPDPSHPSVLAMLDPSHH